MRRWLIILGAPGVGKGTQAVRLTKTFGWKHISTGDMLREAKAQKTVLGEKAYTYMVKGELVPDDLIVEMVGDRLKCDDCTTGFILDGFPRTVGQAEKLDIMLKEMSMEIYTVISVDVPDDEIIRRLSQRLVCEGCGSVVHINETTGEGDVCHSCQGRLIRRKDDEPGTARHRLTVYREQTRSLISYYQQKGLLKTVNGLGSPDDVYERIVHDLGLSPNQK